MAKPLTAEQLARARVLRDDLMPWHDIGPIVHAHSTKVRDALVALGYAPTLKPGHDRDGKRMQEAHDLYMDESIKPLWSPRVLGKKYGVSKDAIKRWVLKCGGTIRGKGGAQDGRVPIATQVGPGKKGWRKTATCSIGRKEARSVVDAGELYCAEECDWTNCYSVKPCEFLHGISRKCLREDIPCDCRVDMCDDEITEENRAGFEQYKAERAEHERKRVADPKRGAGGFTMLAMWGGDG